MKYRWVGDRLQITAPIPSHRKRMGRNLLRRLLLRDPLPTLRDLITRSDMTETSFEFQSVRCTGCPSWVIDHNVGYCLHARVESFGAETFTVQENDRP